VESVGGLVKNYRLSDATWRHVFRPRGIEKELAEARPYVPYSQGDGREVLKAQADLGVPEEARWSDRQLKAAARDTSGLAMMRHPAPLPGDGFFAEFYSRPIMAELRPDDGVADGPIHHRHPDGKTMRPYRKPRDAWQRENELAWWRDLGDLSDIDRAAVFYAENERARNEALWDLARRGEVIPNSKLGAWLDDHPPPKVLPDEVRARRAETSTRGHLFTSHADGEHPRAESLALNQSTTTLGSASVAYRRLSIAVSAMLSNPHPSPSSWPLSSRRAEPGNASDASSRAASSSLKTPLSPLMQ
jgi:hypothetical protein